MTDNEKILARMAQMETELQTLRANARQPATPSFDPVAFAKAMTVDPIGTMKKYNVPIDHVARVMVANTMGDQAPPQLQMYAQMGPQVAQVSELASAVQGLSRRLDEQDKRGRQTTTHQSMKTLLADKAKYPHLAKAYTADPSLFDNDVAGHEGDAEALAATLEKREARRAAAFGVKLEAPAASGESAENVTDQAQSQEGKPANAGSMQFEAPSIPQSKAGVFTNDDHSKLKEEILRKYNLQA